MVDLPPYPPFGFSVWYDRHRGRGWCWRERHPSAEVQRLALDGQAVTEGERFGSRSAAVQAVRTELARRRARGQSTSAE